MAKSTKPDPGHDSLKGTFVSVMLVGAFILLSWLGVWSLFIGRG
jgi:hypothetical protein